MLGPRWLRNRHVTLGVAATVKEALWLRKLLVDLRLVEGLGCPWDDYTARLETFMGGAGGKIILDVGCGTSFPVGPFVPRTSTLALTNATLPYALKLARHGWQEACRLDPSLRLGLNVVSGKVVYPGVAEAFGLPLTEVNEVL